MIIPGISYTSQFDETSPPDLVISEELRPNDENNMAVCFGIRIVKPNYIQALLARFTKCWKRTAADSQDSFCLPDAASEIFQPPLRSENLKPIRNSLAAWLPDPERKNMFAGWTIFGLKKDSKVSQGLSDIVLKRYRYPKREDGSSSWARHIRILM